MKSKADNLTVLAGIAGINVPSFIVLQPKMSEVERTSLIGDFLSLYQGGTLAVRSSAAQEDSTNASFAGIYSTKLRVPAVIGEVLKAVEEVLASETEKKDVISHYISVRGIEDTKDGMSVIVQEMIEADMSGVIFSHDPAKNDGYYAISVSHGPGESVVGGTTNGILVRVVRGVKTRSIRETWVRQVIKAMIAIERCYHASNLDVEFAIRGRKLYILQCRPITTVRTVQNGEVRNLVNAVETLNVSIASQFAGDILGDMIDINPFELLGSEPSPLDVSIFRYLFADRIVERVRRSMGYDPLDIGLLRVVAGKPYTSMRATAYSFRPMGISDHIYERIVNVYRDALTKKPALQSRVEFDVYAMSCGDKLEQIMQKARLSIDQQQVVREAFNRIDATFATVSAESFQSFEEDARSYEQGIAYLLDEPLTAILEYVAFGTEMFVRIARLAFYWKNKFEEMHPDENLNDLIVGHIQSVNNQLQTDLIACRNGEISRDDLVRCYGHLRPGQFSVLGEAYEDDPDTYLFSQLGEVKKIAQAKVKHIFEDTPEFGNVVTFMQARERIKFLFSKALNVFATKLKEQLSQAGISTISASNATWEQLHSCLNREATTEIFLTDPEPILLPDVIIPGVTDLKVITFGEAMPTYITHSTVKARICVIERSGVKVDVKGAIVLLPNADPGYDFLFHSGAVGIITKVGGPASHMCIRSIELEMPACIGCGESTYQSLVSARSAVLDCGSRQIIVLE